MYARTEAERSADIQVVGHIYFDARYPKRDRRGTVIRTSFRKEDEHALDVLHEI